LLLLEHKLAGDNSIIPITMEEVIASQTFRNFIAQTRLGKTKEEHESFFRNMLGDIDEPTVPFGLTNTLGDGTSILESNIRLNDTLAQGIRNLAKVLAVSSTNLFHLALAQVLSVTSGRLQVVCHRALLAVAASGGGRGLRAD
jgi:arthrofactin-type cyclic lipopeptide synthetase B